jgi:hypothetical protein
MELERSRNLGYPQQVHQMSDLAHLYKSQFDSAGTIVSLDHAMALLEKLAKRIWHVSFTTKM